MSKARATLALAAALAVGIPALAQVTMPGAPDIKRVTAGTYKVDPNHTQVFFSVSHMAITPLSGAFGASSGELVLDPARPAAAKVSVTFNMADMSLPSAAWFKHMATAELFDIAKYPTATFTSTSVQPSGGDRAKITGNLTVRGVTRPVVLDAKFYGAGTNERSKKLNIGFTATTRIKRSQFGFNYGLAAVGDDVDLQITGAFEKTT